MMSERGQLSVCATPIGNLEDVTLRVLRVLGEVEVIVAEDTRHSRKLLTRHGISKKLLSYHAHNERARTEEMLEIMKAGGHVALISDAGMPGISDPGSILIRACLDNGIPVDVLPGANAAVTALVLSGLPAEKFLFCGFLPSASGARLRELKELGILPYTLILYEAPHRLTSVLREMADLWPERAAAVVRELTKKHQELVRGTLTELATEFGTRVPKGECCLLLAPPSKEALAPALWQEELKALVAGGASVRDAVAQVAAVCGCSKKEAYQAALSWQDENEPET
jgi:16S rRNA (cytidine1402-2'-O)-methyltransferase